MEETHSDCSTQSTQSMPSPASSCTSIHTSSSEDRNYEIPQTQQQLVILAPKEEYQLKHNCPIPELKAEHELLIRIEHVGLNPIDWKSPAFGFGLPSLPCVLGRDFVGTVVKVPENSTIHQRAGQPLVPSAGKLPQVGDIVLGISTDYRDYRKAAFQQYCVASSFNVCRLPRCLHQVKGTLPAIGVAFVTAALTLGICLGLNFSRVEAAPGPDLHTIVNNLDRENISEDIRDECFSGMSESGRIQSGDWLAIWGASSTVGFLVLQLAKLAGIKVVCIADSTKHGGLLVDAGADVLVHRAHPEEAVSIVRNVTKGKQLRYGVDTVGKDTAELLQSTFNTKSSSSDGIENSVPSQPHMVCLVGEPKDPTSNTTDPPTKHHKVPIKLFHESPEIGWALMTWMEDLLTSEQGLIMLPRTDLHKSTGLESINEGLENLRTGQLSGQRIVVRI